MRTASKDPLRLAGKTVVLTGANGILGRRYVRAYLDAGVRVAALDLKVDRLPKHRNLWAQALDLTDKTQAAAAFSRAKTRFGRIDGLHHNCAGKADGFFDRFEDYRLDTWRSVLSSNIETALPLTQAALPHFKKRKAGSIVFTCSIYGVVGADQRSYEGSSYEGRPINTPAAYAAAKGALAAMVRHLAAELGVFNVRVNALTPGGVASGQNETFTKKYSARVPLGRMARAEEMTGPALFLLSGAASYVTGHNLIVDGGLTAW